MGGIGLHIAGRKRLCVMLATCVFY